MTGPHDDRDGPHGGHDDEMPGDLTPAELGMWQAFRIGAWYDLRSGHPVLDDLFAPRAWPRSGASGRG